MRRLRSLLLLACLTACGGGDPAQAGYDALGSGDHTAAVSSFREARASADAGSAEHIDLTVRLCEALAHTDAEACVRELRTLDTSTDLRVPDYNVVVSELKSAGAYVEATEVLKLAMAAYPKDEKLEDLLKNLGDAAARAGDEDALKSLSGLGYVGDD